MKLRLALTLLAAAASLVAVPAVFGSSAAVAPPSRPGAWQVLGKTAVSRVGGGLHIRRTATTPGPKALAIVLTSPSKQRIRATWASYCEWESDDGYTEEYSGKLSGLHRIEYYPRVFDGATLCYVFINTTPIRGSRVSATAFWY